MLKEAIRLWLNGGAWALLYVFLQEHLGFLVYYAGSSWTLFGGEGLSLSGDPRVTLDLKERLTSKVRAALVLDIPRSKAATTFLRRSSE